MKGRSLAGAERAAAEAAPAEIENFAVIIGGMKSGTTALYRYLRQHPQIAASRKKELNYFFFRKNLNRGREAYFRQWPGFDPSAHRYALEASPNYTKSQTETVARRMRRFGARFRFIYIMRNPVDRIESHLAHNIARGRLELEEARTLDPRAAIRVSSYALQLDSFRAGFGDPEILLLDFEELRRTPLTLLDRCVRHLELDPFQFSLIPPPAGRRTANRANEFRLDAEQRARLAERLCPDAAALRDRYGFDVSGWGLL